MDITRLSFAFHTYVASLTTWELLTARIIAVSLISVPWVRYVVARLPVGIPRLLCAAPVLILFQYFSFSYRPHEEAISGAYVFGFLGWVATFKIAGFCFNRGPLMRQDFSLWQQIPVQLLCIYPTDASAAAGRLAENTESLGPIALRVPIKAAVLRILLQLLKEDRYPSLFTAFQSVALFCYVSMILDLLVLTTRLVFGIHICPAFDQPWRAVSIAEFWSRRWNIAISHLLRQCVYEPIVEGSLTKSLTPPKPTSRTRKDVAIFVSFFVSGVMHELFQYAMNRTALGLMFIFFTGQAPLMMLERYIIRIAKDRHVLPSPRVRNIISVGIVLAFGSVTFWPSVQSTGLTKKVVQLQLDSFLWLDKIVLYLYDRVLEVVNKVAA